MGKEQAQIDDPSFPPTCAAPNDSRPGRARRASSLGKACGSIIRLSSNQAPAKFSLPNWCYIEFGIGADITTKMSFEYTHSWTDSTSESETRSYTFRQSAPITVPAGKVYKVVLTAKSQKLTVPYRALIYVDGVTETWFEDRVKGHNNWSLRAGEAFEKIGQWGKAGAESHSYGRDPQKFWQGVITQYGKVTAQQTANFVAQVYDITASFKDEQEPGVMRLLSVESAPVAGKLVHEIPF